MSGGHASRTSLAALLVASLMLGSLATLPAPRPDHPAPAYETTAAHDNPGSFIPNRGQLADDAVLLTGSGVAFREGAVVLAVGDGSVTLSFPGARAVAPQGEGELEQRSHFLLGNDSAGWRTDVPGYARVIYRELYDGIDLVWYYAGGGLKYDWIVHPGGDPDFIRERYDDSAGLRLTSAGGLEVATPHGTLHHDPPVTTQNGTPVASRYRQLDPQTLGYAIAPYDTSRTLVIDPLVWSTFFGGKGTEEGEAITLDDEGNVYITGEATSQNFPITESPYDDTYNGGDYDAFVAKFSSDGELIYSTFIGGSKMDIPYDIAVDSEGCAYITGRTESPDFPATKGAFDTTFHANENYEDIFVAKLSPNGSSLEYATYIGGNGTEMGKGISVTDEGYALVTGYADGHADPNASDFPVTPGAFSTNHTHGYDAFVLKLSQNGSTLLFSSLIGGGDMDIAYGIAFDTAKNIYITGSTESSDFPVTNGAFDTSHNHEPDDVWPSDVFVFKLNPNGTDLIYSTFLGGGDIDEGYGIAVDDQGQAFVTGRTRGWDYPVVEGSYDTTHNGYFEAFVTKLNRNGSALLFSTFLGGSGLDNGKAITVNTEGMVFVTGNAGGGFPTTPGSFSSRGSGWGGAYISIISDNGSKLNYSAILGGSNIDFGRGIVVDNNGNIYITGLTISSDFPTTNNAYSPNFSGDIDCFLLKLEPTPEDAISKPDDNELCGHSFCLLPLMVILLVILLIVSLVRRSIRRSHLYHSQYQYPPQY